MLKYIRAENIKAKGSKSLILAITLPILTIVISILLGGFHIFTRFVIYWWEALFLTLLIVLIVLSSYINEEKAEGFFNIKTINLEWGKDYFAKNIVVLKPLLISNLILFLLIYLIAKYLAVGVEINQIKTNYLIFSLFLSIITQSWIIPLTYLLIRKLGNSLSIIINISMGFLIAPLLASTKLWYFVPYTYIYRLNAHLLGVAPSGDLVKSKIYSSNINIFIPVLMSFILFLLFYQIGRKSFFKKEG